MAGSARSTNLDLSTLSIGGASVLTDLRSAVLSVDLGEEESSILTRAYQSHSATVRSATLKTQHVSVISAPTKATNLDVSAFALGGTSYIGECESGSITVEWQHGEGKGCTDAWAYPVLVKKTIAGEATMIVPAAAGIMLASNALNSTLANLALTFSVTINTVAFTFAAFLKSFEHSINAAETQKHKVSFLGRDPDTGTFPAAPTASTTLPEKVINGTAALAVSGVTKASGGYTFAGNFVPQSMVLSWSNSGLVTTDYTFLSQDAVTGVLTA